MKKIKNIAIRIETNFQGKSYFHFHCHDDFSEMDFF